MEGRGMPSLEKVNAKEELEKVRIQIHNTEHSLQMLKAMEKRLIEMSR